MSRPVGGVLSSDPFDRCRSHEPPEWPSICAAYLGTSAGPAVPRLALLRVGFAEPPGSPRALVRSYRTVSPLPVPTDPVTRAIDRPLAVCSLWHFPAGRPDWPLASTLPCGAPTFLDPVAAETGDAEPRPPGRLTVVSIVACQRVAGDRQATSTRPPHSRAC